MPTDLYDRTKRQTLAAALLMRAIVLIRRAVDGEAWRMLTAQQKMRCVGWIAFLFAFYIVSLTNLFLVLALVVSGVVAKQAKPEFWLAINDQLSRLPRFSFTFGRGPVGPLDPHPETQPPVWPPRKPDDWGRALQDRYVEEMRNYHYRQSTAQNAGLKVHYTMPTQPIIPSWDEHQRNLMRSDPKQIRWALTQQGTWQAIPWGNDAMAPPIGAPMPVYQVMKRTYDGVWVWVRIGVSTDLSLDWQHGELRDEMFVTETVGYLRPCGTAGYQKPPPPAPDDDPIRSPEMTEDDLREAGII